MTAHPSDPSSSPPTPDAPGEGLLDAPADVPTEVVVLDTPPDAADGEGPPPPGTFRKILSGMATLVALIAATYLVPPLAFARPWTADDPVLFWNLLGREILGEDEAPAEASEALAVAESFAQEARHEGPTAPIADREIIAPPLPAEVEAGPPPYEPHEDDATPVPRSLELPTPEALDPFFASLTATDAGYADAITRVTHWGDSVVANDNVTSALRGLMQARFGDAGHGFHLIAKPNASYRHRGISFADGEAWSRCYIINDCKKDGHYGLGGTTVWSAGGARSVFATSDRMPYGHKVSRFELWYAGDPRGGDVRLRVDDQEPTLLSTRADAFEDRWHTLDVPDGPHRLEVRAAGGGRVRLYGVVLERDVPGVVWDGMAQLGAFTSRMLNFDPDHLRRQIEHRDADLLVFQFGGNDLLLKGSALQRLEEQTREVLQRFRGSDDPRPCLVVSPVDHGVREGGRILSVPNMDDVTDMQRRAALAEGCAFFDTRAAMGGDRSVAQWRHANPPLISGDLAHLTVAGQQVLGKMIYLALMERYREYRSRPESRPVSSSAPASRSATHGGGARR